MEMDINSLAMMAKGGDEKAFTALLNRMDGAIGKVVSNYAVGEATVTTTDPRQCSLCITALVAMTRKRGPS